MLDKLTTLVPWYYRLLALVLLAMATWSHGYMKGLAHDQHKLDEYRSQVEAVAAQQEGRAAQIIQSNNKAKGDIEDAYNQSIVAIRNYYDKQLRQQRPQDGGHMPADTQAAGGTDSASRSCSNPIIATRLATALLQIKQMNEYWKRICGAGNCR